MPNPLRQIQTAFATPVLSAIVFAIVSVALVRDTWFNGHDFEVMWRAGRDALTSADLYSLDRERGMVFKYPPWTIFFFIPWGLLSLEAAKLCWGLFEVLSLGAIGFWLGTRARAGWGAVTGTGIAFFGLWAVHALDGQIALPMLAAALWCWPGEGELRPRWRSLVLTWALSIKVFTALPLLSFRIGRSWISTMVVALGLFALLALPFGSLSGLVRTWIASASSGGALLGEEHVRGSFNPSFTGALLSLAGVPASQPKADVVLATLLAAAFGLAWWRVSRHLSPEERWCGWLALVPAIHPLPWWHLFVFAFPLATLAIDRGWQGRGSRLLALCGVFLIAAGTHRFLGIFGLEGFGYFLEKTAGKSFGILACAGALLLAPAQPRQRPGYL